MSETKEKPILFSAPMVKAILEGRKVQTRRIVKPQPPKWIDELHGNELRKRAPYDLEDNETGCIVGRGFQDDNDVFYKFPYGTVGDRLWIKTGYSTRYDTFRDETTWSIGSAFTRTHGRAYSKSGKPKRDGNHPGMFMPRWLSDDLRLPVLEITGVKVERLMEITEEDAKAEGVEPDKATDHPRGVYYTAYRELWNQINGSNSWAQNPFVWVIEFRNQ